MEGSSVVRVVQYHPKGNETCHQTGFNLEIVSFFYHITPARTSIGAHDIKTPNTSGKLRRIWMMTVMGEE